MDATQRYKLRKFVNQLKGIRGRHTELVSVYVPAGYDMIKIIQHLDQEKSTASNIKDKTNRKNVVDALERMIRHLRLFKTTPPNGLAVFSGNKSDNPSKVDTDVWSIEPPDPVTLRLYRCDHDFKLDVLEEMLHTLSTYGLIVMDNRDGCIGFLHGTRITKSKELHSAVPGKQKAGGQCLAVDTTILLADGQIVAMEEVLKGDEVMSYDFDGSKLKSSKVIKKWTTNVEEVYKVFTAKETLECSKDHLIFLEDGSTIPAEKITSHNFLLDEKGKPVKVKDVISSSKTVEMIDLEVENKNFIANGLVVHNSQQRFARGREIAAHEFWKRIAEVANNEFFTNKDLKGIFLGGPGMTKEKFLAETYLHADLKKKIIAIKDLSYTGEFGLEELVDKSQEELANEEIVKEKKILEEFFTTLAKNSKKVAYGRANVVAALDAGAVDKLLISEDRAEEFEDLEGKAVAIAADVMIISSGTKEGGQLKDLGGIAAILRYEIN